MPPTRRSSFRTNVLLSGLVTRDQLSRAIELVRSSSSGGTVSVESVAEKLIELELLTSYQVTQIRAGRSKLNLGDYLITDWIGQGGMGQVYLGVHQMMGRESAIKVLPREKSTDEAIASFQREIRMQAQLDHPNLVRAFDAGHDGNVHYLVTEYVPGTDLRRLLKAQGPLPAQQAASIIMQAAVGLESAHERGLIHRDVKPGNILVTPDGIAKVSDLGLSAFIHRPDEDPRAGKIVGTVDYLSPEQIRAPLEVTSVSDIYSLGCTLYYAVTGKVPFPGGTISEKTRRHLEETPWHPRRFSSELSEEFVEIIADMMEKDPAARIQTAGDVAARLEPWAGDTSPIAPYEMRRTPWMAPPPPSDEEEELQDTNVAAFDEIEFQPAEDFDSFDQLSDTAAVGAANHDTLPANPSASPTSLSPNTRAVYAHPAESPGSAVAIALAISIPVSLLVGAVLGFLLHSVMK